MNLPLLKSQKSLAFHKHCVVALRYGPCRLKKIYQPNNGKADFSELNVAEEIATVAAHCHLMSRLGASANLGGEREGPPGNQSRSISVSIGGSSWGLASASTCSHSLAFILHPKR